MATLLIDAHTHLDKYDDDEVDAVIAAIEADRILTVSVSVDPTSFSRAEEIAAGSRFVIPGYGIHPSEAADHVADLDAAMRPASRSPMIGEIGLDHRFVEDTSSYPAQAEVFAAFLETAVTQGKIVNVHCTGAEDIAADMLRSHGVDRVIVHWYSGPLEVLEVMIGRGHLLTIGVEVLHSDHIREIARRIPTEQLLAETDNPGGCRWLTGVAGQPSLLADVVAEIARVRAVEVVELVERMAANAARLFDGDPHLEPWRSLLVTGGIA